MTGIARLASKNSSTEVPDPAERIRFCDAAASAAEKKIIFHEFFYIKYKILLLEIIIGPKNISNHLLIPFSRQIAFVSHHSTNLGLLQKFQVSKGRKQ